MLDLVLAAADGGAFVLLAKVQRRGRPWERAGAEGARVVGAVAVVGLGRAGREERETRVADCAENGGRAAAGLVVC